MLLLFHDGFPFSALCGLGFGKFLVCLSLLRCLGLGMGQRREDTKSGSFVQRALRTMVSAVLGNQCQELSDWRYRP